jgi:hypothetical protein
LSMHRAQIANWPKSIEIALAHAQQGKVAFKNLAVGNPRAHGELPINQRVDVDALEVFANKGKARVGVQVVGQLFDNKVGHVGVHLQGESHMTPKSLISMGNQLILTMGSRIQAIIRTGCITEFRPSFTVG